MSTVPRMVSAKWKLLVHKIPEVNLKYLKLCPVTMGTAGTMSQFLTVQKPPDPITGSLLVYIVL